ncbi:MAG: GAF domain-containing protein [Elusimicrobiota bacterium]
MPKKLKQPGIKDLKIEITLLHHIVDIVTQSNDLDSLLTQIARSLAVSLKCDSCLIYLLEHSSQSLILSGACPPHPNHVGKLRLGSGEGITGWVASHKKPVVLSKNAFKDSRFKFFSNLPEDRYAAFLSIPITLKNELIGVINLQNRKPRNYGESLTKLLTSVSNQIAAVIEKTRLQQLAVTKTKQLETIAQLSRTIVSSSYLQEILQLIVTMTAQMMNSKICSLMLFDSKKQELKIVSTQSLSEKYLKKPPLKVGMSISGKAVETLQPVAILDVKVEPQYGYPEIAKQEGLCSMLAVPLLIKNKPIGVVNIYTVVPHHFTDDEKDILQTVANQAAVAIENTRLFEETQAAQEALETRKQVEKAKGILMKGRGMTEEEAFQFIQRQAMNMRRTMKEIAHAILLTEGLKNPEKTIQE